MKLPHPNDQNHWLRELLDHPNPSNWDEITNVLQHFSAKKRRFSVQEQADYGQFFGKGAAFITFSYGIDGVSIEISKYAHALENLFSRLGTYSIHLIGESFQPETSSIFGADWHQFRLAGVDGWDKWDGGIWFNALFRKKIRSRSKRSRCLAEEIYIQAISIADRLGKYLIENRISLLIPVNVASNPGNLAATLGIVLATEALGIYVLNNNHDFYWEGGKSLAERDPGEVPGVRDHFFRNIKNRSLFKLISLLYPWNGKRWLQVNINARQSRKLIQKYNFPKDKVFEISTSISDQFLESYNLDDTKHARVRMAHILSNGKAIMHSISVDGHIERLDQWMKNQTPCIVGSHSELTVDPRSEDLIILLQPTRIVGRKRIAKNVAFIEALLTKSRLRADFENNPFRQIVLHISGPTPIEHKADLIQVLRAYQKTVNSLPEFIAPRFLMAFSTGHDQHASFSEHNFSPMSIEDIYRMANLVVFPSSTEGRGLPIIEASAMGIPIVCSRYQPKEVFEDVIGKHLPTELQIQYIHFPERKFSQAFLSEVASVLLDSTIQKKYRTYNRRAVKSRYSRGSFNTKFEGLLEHLGKLD